MDDCCNYYNDDTCVDECPAPRRPSDDNRCSKTEINIKCSHDCLHTKVPEVTYINLCKINVQVYVIHKLCDLISCCNLIMIV